MLNKITNRLYQGINNLNNSKFFAGIAMIILNIGSRYVTIDISKSQEALLKNTMARQLLIFSIAWLGSRDLFVSLILTFLFVIVTDYLMNEKSKLCILPKHLKNLESALDTNNDGVIDEIEITNAIKLLEKARKQKRKVELREKGVNMFDISL